MGNCIDLFDIGWQPLLKNVCNSFVEQYRKTNRPLPKQQPDIDAATMEIEARDNIVGAVYSRLMEIESRLLPCGIHVVGKPPTAEEAIATLVNIASLDREEEGIKGLPRTIADSIDRDLEEVYQNNDRGILADVQLLQDITQAVRAAVASIVTAQVNDEGRISLVSRLNLFNMGKKDAWVESLYPTFRADFLSWLYS